MSNYYNHDTILDLMRENAKLKDLLQRCLPEIRERVKGLNACWPGTEILLHAHRNDRLLADIEHALIGWETNDTP